jgi:acyl-CoA thioester hydrolase
LTNLKFEELRIGPILFREEALFKREVKFEDRISVDLVVTKATADFSRWSVRHHIYKEDRTIAAILNMDGAWIDMAKRKLAIPNEFIKKVFEDFPKSEEFEWIVRA